MLPTPRLLPALACTLLTTIATHGFAQIEPPRPAAPAQAPSRSHPFSDEGPVISVNFPGGTLSDYIAALREAAGAEHANVALSAHAADLDTPPLQLRSVTLYTALKAIQFAVQPPGGTNWMIQPISGGSQPDAGPASTPAFAVGLNEFSTAANPGQPAAAEPRVVVFSMRELISGPDPHLSVQTVLTAIDTALGMDSGKNIHQPRVEFHQDSDLLLVKGTSAQLTTISQVIDRLQGDLHQQRSGSDHARREKADRDLAIQKAQAQFGISEARHQVSTDRLHRAEETFKAGQMSSEELAQARLGEQESAANLSIAQAELHAVEAGAAPSPARPGSSEKDSPDHPRPSAVASDPHARIAALEQMIAQAQQEIQALRAALGDDQASPPAAKPQPKRKP